MTAIGIAIGVVLLAIAAAFAWRYFFPDLSRLTFGVVSSLRGLLVGLSVAAVVFALLLSGSLAGYLVAAAIIAYVTLYVLFEEPIRSGLRSLRKLGAYIRGVAPW